MESTITQHTECIAQATIDIFSATCGLTLEPVSDDTDLADDEVIIAVISLVGDVEWSLFVCLPRDTASALAAKFAGFEIPFESEDMGDAIGELTNILAGDVKLKLDAKAIKAELSLPSVMRAESIEVLVQRNSVIRKTCFNSSAGKLWTGVSVGKDDPIIT